MLHKFTEVQKRILDELKRRPESTNPDLIRALDIKEWKFHKELGDLRHMFGPATTRFAMVGLAEKAGWRPSVDVARDANITGHITRLVADSFPDGPLKPLAIDAEKLHHEAANLATEAWGECENRAQPTERLLDRLKARAARVRAQLDQLDERIDAMRKAANVSHRQVK